MMTKRLLDLYCGVGGASVGYHRAGWEVTGVDINPQPDYPFDFVQMDALTYLTLYGWEYDAIHASPPCQSESALTKGTNKGREYPDLLVETIIQLGAFQAPIIVENVEGARMRKDFFLCGEMFGLRVLRHRYFELSNWAMDQPHHPKHRGRVAGMRHGEWFEGPYFAVYGRGGGKGTVEQWRDAMGIDWTWNRKSIAEAIPPAYTELIGRNLLEKLNG